MYTDAHNNLTAKGKIKKKVNTHVIKKITLKK